MIGLKDNLQENPMIFMENRWFPVKIFPANPLNSRRQPMTFNPAPGLGSPRVILRKGGHQDYPSEINGGITTGYFGSFNGYNCGITVWV
jgi:hypothetical protein